MSIDAKKIIEVYLPGWAMIKNIGSGGFKEVYLIGSSHAREALKITQLFSCSAPPRQEQEEIELMLRARTEREFRLLSKYGGGCIVSLGTIPCQEISTDGDRFIIYSEEFLPGQTLDGVISYNKNNKQVPSPVAVKTVFVKGLEVIERMWNEKIVHRDIKPQNIMITGDEQRPVVFFDLGIAFDKAGTSLTAQAFGPGTLRYRAPETLDPDYRSSIDFRCDLFSLAATVYEYAVGFHPIHHGSLTEGETVYRLLKRNAEPLFNHRTDIEIGFCRLIDKCLHKAPALRPIRIGDIRRIAEV